MNRMVIIMDMKDMTVADLAALTASDTPAPGGGSISALAGVFCSALVEMVARLTMNKKGFAEARPEMLALIEKATALRTELLDDVQKDSNSFDAYMEALALPKETEGQKAERRQAMQNALKHAADVPLHVAEKAATLMPLCQLVVKSGNPNSITDGLVAVMMGRTAVLGALYNVKINLASIRDEAYVTEMKAKVCALEERVNAAETAIRAYAAQLDQ